MGAGLPAEVHDAQARDFVTCSDTDYTADVDDGTAYRLRVAYEVRGYELTGATPTDGRYFRAGDLRTALAAAAPLAFEGDPDGTVQLRLVSRRHTRFLADDLSGPLEPGALGGLGLVHSSYGLALTPTLLAARDGGRATPSLLDAAGYVGLNGDGNQWRPSATAVYALDAADHFYLPAGQRDPFGNVATVTRDGYDLLTVSTVDAVGNTAAAAYDYRLMAPVLTTDANQNRVGTSYDALGRVVAVARRGKAVAGDGDTLADPTAGSSTDPPLARRSASRPAATRSSASGTAPPTSAGRRATPIPTAPAPLYVQGAGRAGRGEPGHHRRPAWSRRSTRRRRPLGRYRAGGAQQQGQPGPASSRTSASRRSTTPAPSWGGQHVDGHSLRPGREGGPHRISGRHAVPRRHRGVEPET